jgi:hypothetical protein
MVRMCFGGKVWFELLWWWTGGLLWSGTDIVVIWFVLW